MDRACAGFNFQKKVLFFLSIESPHSRLQEVCKLQVGGGHSLGLVGAGEVSQNFVEAGEAGTTNPKLLGNELTSNRQPFNVSCFKSMFVW